MKQPPIPLAKAWERLLGPAEPLGQEILETACADGRYLAADIHARRTQPAADLSAMDGYALCHGDDAGPWHIVGESAAGHPFDSVLERGQAARISTGALLPRGAGSIVLQENVLRSGDQLQLNGEGVPSPRHIRRAGFDFRTGDRVLARGTAISAPQIAAAISAGHGTLPVHRLPSMAVMDSGDELSSDPAKCLPHQIPASNGAMIAAMLAPLGCAVTRIGPVPDSREALGAALAQAEAADILITSGGASVGDHDLIKPALADWGAQTAFWNVAIKPGKPLLVARRPLPNNGSQVILGLPGNPASAFVTGFLFMLPLLRAAMGAQDPLPRTIPARLAHDMPAGGSRMEFLRALWDGATVTLDPLQDSGALSPLARANALVVREARAPAAAAGTDVPVYLLESGGIA